LSQNKTLRFLKLQLKKIISDNGGESKNSNFQLSSRAVGNRPIRKDQSMNNSRGNALILTMLVAGIVSFFAFSVISKRASFSKEMGSIKQKLAALLIMESVGQRIKSAYDMYIPFGSASSAPSADACYGGEWQQISLYSNSGTQESAYFCFPKNGEICVKNPFDTSDAETCFSLGSFQNSQAQNTFTPLDENFKNWNLKNVNQKQHLAFQAKAVHELLVKSAHADLTLPPWLPSPAASESLPNTPHSEHAPQAICQKEALCARFEVCTDKTCSEDKKISQVIAFKVLKKTLKRD
jgi:hypothetical protein